MQVACKASWQINWKYYGQTIKPKNQVNISQCNYQIIAEFCSFHNLIKTPFFLLFLRFFTQKFLLLKMFYPVAPTCSFWSSGFSLAVEWFFNAKNLVCSCFHLFHEESPSGHSLNGSIKLLFITYALYLEFSLGFVPAYWSRKLSGFSKNSCWLWHLMLWVINKFCSEVVLLCIYSELCDI